MNDKLSADKLVSLSNKELAQIARDITGRLHNQDWQQVVADLKLTGHIHTFRESAPPFLQKFLKLEADLDGELAKQASAAPLMSTISLDPRRPKGDEPRVMALLASQDEGSHMRLEIHPSYEMTSVAFSVKSMLTLRFNLPNLDVDERYTFLDMLRRDQGISFLWTPDRWERDFLIFIKREFFTRVYAFSSGNEATARLTTEVIGTLTDWLEKAWFPRTRRRQTKRATQALSALNPATLGLSESVAAAITETPIITSVPIAPAPTPVLAALDEASLGQVIQQLIQLDISGRNAIMGVAGEHLEVVGRIFTAPSREAIMEEFRAHPDLFERVQAKLNALGLLGGSASPTTPPADPAPKPKPAPIVDPDLDEW
jgi:hypothetical protein